MAPPLGRSRPSYNRLHIDSSSYDPPRKDSYWVEYTSPKVEGATRSREFQHSSRRKDLHCRIHRNYQSGPRLSRRAPERTPDSSCTGMTRKRRRPAEPRCYRS